MVTITINKFSIALHEYDVLDELTNVCVKIPLFQAIKDIPIYTKSIKELCLNKTGREERKIHQQFM